MANKSKKEAASVDRASLSEHIDAFLKSGGKVKEIPTGTSGQTNTSGPRQIVLSHKSTA